MSKVAYINIKADNPGVDIALYDLNKKIEESILENKRVIKVVHGYGSSGIGGKIKAQTRITLKQLEKKGRILTFIPGEVWVPNKIKEHGLTDMPELFIDKNGESMNSGCTIIVLNKKS